MMVMIMVVFMILMFVMVSFLSVPLGPGELAWLPVCDAIRIWLTFSRKSLVEGS
jgi:hypothetical protein